MAKAQHEIGERTYKEIQRIFESDVDARKQLGISSKQLMYDWMCGVAPSAKYLQRLYYCGADVIYILTGRSGLYELPTLQKREYKSDRYDEWPSK